MWYWIVMAVLVIGCIALLSGTFFSIKKNKAEEAAKRAEARKKKRKKPADAEEAQQPGDRRKRAEETPPVESNPGRSGFVDKVQFYFLQ